MHRFFAYLLAALLVFCIPVFSRSVIITSGEGEGSVWNPSTATTTLLGEVQQPPHQKNQQQTLSDLKQNLHKHLKPLLLLPDNKPTRLKPVEKPVPYFVKILQRRPAAAAASVLIPKVLIDRRRNKDTQLLVINDDNATTTTARPSYYFAEQQQQQAFVSQTQEDASSETPMQQQQTFVSDPVQLNHSTKLLSSEIIVTQPSEDDEGGRSSTQFSNTVVDPPPPHSLSGESVINGQVAAIDKVTLPEQPPPELVAPKQQGHLGHSSTELNVASSSTQQESPAATPETLSTNKEVMLITELPTVETPSYSIRTTQPTYPENPLFLDQFPETTPTTTRGENPPSFLLKRTTQPADHEMQASQYFTHSIPVTTPISTLLELQNVSEEKSVTNPTTGSSDGGGLSKDQIQLLMKAAITRLVLQQQPQQQSSTPNRQLLSIIQHHQQDSSSSSTPNRILLDEPNNKQTSQMPSIINALQTLVSSAAATTMKVKKTTTTPSLFDMFQENIFRSARTTAAPPAAANHQQSFFINLLNRVTTDLPLQSGPNPVGGFSMIPTLTRTSSRIIPATTPTTQKPWTEFRQDHHQPTSNNKSPPQLLATILMAPANFMMNLFKMAQKFGTFLGTAMNGLSKMFNGNNRL